MGSSTIEVQIEKVFRHTRQNSFATRDRYKDSCRQFGKFIHDHFKLQNVRNVSDKHVAAYVQQRQQEGKAVKTIKNDLAAIRYLHDQISNPRYSLSDNKKLQSDYGLKLDKTPQITGDRAWTRGEYKQMKNIALQLGNQNAVDVMTMARTMGLRIAEAVSSRRSQAENALRTGIYQVQGEAKNGKHRSVPLSPEVKEVFLRRMRDTTRGGRLFVKPGEKTHRVINRLEKFLDYHRSKAETQEGRELRNELRENMELNKPLTYHGLRYNYVQERMHQEQGKGFTEEQAAAIVSREVGHERIDVIKIYQGIIK